MKAGNRARTKGGAQACRPALCRGAQWGEEPAVTRLFQSDSLTLLRAQIAGTLLTILWRRSFRKIAFMCTFTVDSVITRLRAITLLDAPCISMRRISISRRDRDGTSLVWFSFATSTSTRVSGNRGWKG